MKFVRNLLFITALMLTSVPSAFAVQTKFLIANASKGIMQDCIMIGTELRQICIITITTPHSQVSTCSMRVGIPIVIEYGIPCEMYAAANTMASVIKK